MSLASWKEEFYPIHAIECPKEEAVAHSLRKWEGLRKENLTKHGLAQDDRYIEEDGIPTYFEFSGSTCALCHHYADNGCDGCPLYEARGAACDSYTDEERITDTNHPFGAGVTGPNPSPEPMIMWLQKARDLNKE